MEPFLVASRLSGDHEPVLACSGAGQIDCTDDGTERYEQEMKDVFEIQDEITRAIVNALQVHLGRLSGVSLVRPTTDNALAYESTRL